MGIVVSIANQKGGVGKTTTAINLAASVAIAQRRTLLIDCDPQGNSSSGLAAEQETRHGKNLYNCLCGNLTLAETAQPTAVPYLDIIAANQDLVGAEIEMVSHTNREKRLQVLMGDIVDKYDYIFIDCPPALGLLTINALVASDTVLIPLQCEYFALEGISYLLQTIRRVQQAWNPRLQIEGILLTMFDPRNSLAHFVMADARKHFGAQVFNAVIPRSVRLSECPSHGKPILLYDVKSRGSLAYLALAQEILSKRSPSEGRN